MTPKTPENDLLKACLALDPPPHFPERIRELLAHPLNWVEIRESAAWHGVSCLMYRNLKSVESCPIPASFLDELKQLYQNNAVRNLYIRTLLGQVLSAFYTKGIECIVLKGMGLAEIIYRDIALRPMGDIDLLVRPDSLDRAEFCLKEMGFFPDPSFNREWALEHHYHLVYQEPNQHIAIDLHWHISHERHPHQVQIDNPLIEAWWERAVSTPIAGSQGKVLSPGDMLFQLCHHFLKSRFATEHRGFISRAGLIQLCDIAHTIEYYQGDIDWRQIKADADRHSMNTMLCTTLYLAVNAVFENTRIFHNNGLSFSEFDEDREKRKLIFDLLFERADSHTRIAINGLNVAYGSPIEKISSLFSSIVPDKRLLSEKYGVTARSKVIYLYYLIYPLSLLLSCRKFGAYISRVRKEASLKQWLNKSGR